MHGLQRASLSTAIFISRLNNALGLVSGILVLVTTLLVVYEVVMRYVLRNPTSWSLEITEYMLVGTVFLAAAYTLRVGGHVNVDLVSQRLPLRVQMVLNIITSIFALVFCGVLIWQSGMTALASLKGGWVSMSPAALPMAPSYALIPIGATLLALQILIKIADYVASLQAGEPRVLIDFGDAD